MQETIFALDCGATNWRLYRVSYKREGGRINMLGEPQPSPLTSFANRRLPAMLLLNPEGTGLEGFGEIIQQQLEDETIRERIRDYFKPCIGSHQEKAPLPHQTRFTHTQALKYTKMLLEALLDQLIAEKWRGNEFDDRVRFFFAFPVHWRYDHDGVVFDEFRDTILSCFPENIHDQIDFVSEPEGAMLSLHRQGLLPTSGNKKKTLIADVGGSTTDLLAGQVNPVTGDLEYAQRFGVPHGGGLYDAELAKHYADELKIPASALADDPSAMITLRDYARQLKETLSRQLLRPGESLHTPKRTITLVMRDGQVYRRVTKLDEPAFLGICRHLITDFKYILDKGLDTMGLSDSDIDRVILVGGGAQLFTIVRHLRERFGDEAIILADNPEEIVVHGTALKYGKSFETHTHRILYTSQPQKQQEKEKPTPHEWQLVTTSGRYYPLSSNVITIGRKRSNHIWLKDDLVSRFHAEIKAEQDSFVITDLGSTNGTCLNGQRIPAKKPHPLQPGDKIKIGAIEFTCIKSATLLRS